MEQSIFLHASGSAFLENKYDLRKLELILSNYRQLIDQVVILDLKHPKLTKKFKNELIYQVTIKPGSLDVILDFFYQHKENILSLFLCDGGLTLANFVTKMIRAIIELRRIYTSLLEKGLKPTIKIEQNIEKDNSIRYDINNAIIEINDPKIIIGTGNTKNPLDRLIRGTDGEKIHNISLKHQNLETNITTQDHRITGTQKEELFSNIEITGRLDMIIFSSHKGNIIFDGKKYPVLWDEEIKSKIHEVADVEGAIFKVRPIFDLRLLKKEPIAFHIIDCRKVTQESLKF